MNSLHTLIHPYCLRILNIQLLAALLALLATTGRTHAINASPTPVQLRQPDGRAITLRVRGDEWSHWFEDLAGYTVVLNKGAYVYAALDPQGALAPTPLAVGLADPAASGLAIKSGPTAAYRQQRRAAAQAAPPPPGLAPVGTIKNLVILCKFSNHTNGIHNRAPADYTTLMNTIGGDATLAPTGSLLDYYKTNSYGTMTLTSTVIAWVNLPQTEAYYAGGGDGLGTYPNNAQRMVEDALNAANATVNFGQFDSDNDGFIDAIDIIHSGYAAETGGGSGNWIWSHRWGLPSNWSSGDTNALGVSVKVNAYHTEAALWSTSGTNLLRVGVIAHETGHFFGLPDLYDTDNSSEGIGSWCLMANSWGFDNSQLHPPQFSAWCRQQLNFTVPVVITNGSYNIGRAETVSQTYKVSSGYPSGEYLLIENRQPWGFETDIPQGGLCVWHIDEAKSANTSEGYPGQAGWPANNNHYKIALLQADGLYEMEHDLNRGNGGDVFRSGGVSTLGAATNTWPNTAAYKSGVILNTSNVLSAISVSGSNMSFTLATGTFSPPPTIPVAVDATNLIWTTGGSAPWDGQTSVTHDGVDAAQSGSIPDFGTSYVETTVTGPSTLTFWWKVSSESGYDFLRVAMDGNSSNAISGEVGFTLVSLPIPAGSHAVRWTYSKDVNTVSGLDAGFLDGVTNTPTTAAPVLAAIEAGALAYTENQAATVITATITASDADSANLASGTVSITANYSSSQDVLSMSPNPQNGITATYNAGTGVLTLSGSATVANYQAALRSVRYNNTSESPSTATRTVSFLVNDGALNSNPQTRNITVATVNDLPTLAAIEAGALGYTENQAATPVTATLTASDADSANLASGTVSITANYSSSQDVLSMSPNPQNGITATYNAGTGVLTLSGSATVANYQVALRSVSYYNTSENPSTAPRTASFVVNDGAANSSAAARTITVAGVNDAPVLANLEAGALSYAANQVATTITASLTASDADHASLAGGTASLTANFTSGQDVLAMTPNPQNGITASYNAGGGVLTLSGSSTVANYQAALRSVTYYNSSATPATAPRTVSFVINDGAASSSAAARTINVTGAGPVPPVVPVSSNITSILLYVDDTSVPSAYQSALDYAGLPYQFFTDEGLFNSVVSTSAPNSTLAIVDSIEANHDFGPVVSFVAGGGRALLYYWDLDGNPAVAAAFNVTTVQDIFTPVPVYDWGGSFFFSQVGSPLALFERGYNDDGDKLQPTLGGVAVAGHTAAAADGQACVVVGNSGRTIVNAMALQDATNAPITAAQLALNEIYFLLAPGGGGRVAVLGAEEDTWNEDVRVKLLGTGGFEAVDVFDVRSSTPSLAELRAYSAVLVYSDFGFNNAALLGDVLADYVDGGGGVVLGTFATLTGSAVAGRFASGGYAPYVPGGFGTGSDLALVADQASHPILAGVTSLAGGGSSYHGTVTVAPNASLVAHWDNGVPLVMTRVTGRSRVVGLNMFPPSETVRNDLWRTNSAGALLMANALRWSALPDCTLQANYVAATTFTDAVLVDITVAVAFDGTNIWTASGGDVGGDRLARYSAAGVFEAAFAPGIDFRSIFTDAGGQLYARGVGSSEILRQTTPGTFVTHVVLSDVAPDVQASVVLNGNGNEYVALSNGVVSRWSTNGSYLGAVPLAGFGTVAGEDGDIQNMRLAAVGNSWLTYNGNQVLSVWNQSGSRSGTTVLQDAGTSFDSGVSISYCAGKAFILDTSGGLWKGYDICTSPELPYLSRPVRLAGGQFQMDLHAAPARSYAIERSSDFVFWVPFTTNLMLAPNITITDTGAAGTNLFYRARSE